VSLRPKGYFILLLSELFNILFQEILIIIDKSKIAKKKKKKKLIKTWQRCRYPKNCIGRGKCHISTWSKISFWQL
jgi:hypothetical protein